MKANTFPFDDGGNAAILAAARNDLRGSSFRRQTNPMIGVGPLSSQRAANAVTGLGSVSAKGFPRNLPKLAAPNVPSLPQISQVRRTPGGVRLPGGVSNPGVMKPRKLAPIGSAADKGKQLLNAALDGGSEKKKKKKRHHRDKKSKKKHRKRPPGSNVDKMVADKQEEKGSENDPVEQAAAQARMHLCELLDTQKGRGILMQEAKIRKAFREGHLMDLHFERKPNESLGIAFNIPARVSAMNWMSQQRLIVGSIKKGSPAEAAKMEIDDIVARIGDHDCQSIERFKEDISGKASFTITVARCKGVNVEDIRKVRKKIEVQVMETARKRARQIQKQEEV